jgi:hypothetical protein
MKVKSAAVGVLVAGAALSSAALTLGPARGAAWIGQPLALSVVVQLEAGQGASALCAEADVFHADSKQDAGRVNVFSEPGSEPDTARLRVVSTVPVDEPVVTVYLRAGCGAKNTRRYVLLADYQSDALAPAPHVATESAPMVPTVLPADAVTAKPLAKAPRAAKPLAKPSPAASPDRSIPAPSNATAKPAATERARLRLDPLENLAKRIATLETATAVSAAAPPDEAVRDTQLMLQLQADIKALADKAAKNEVTLMALREQLLKAEAERTPAVLIYALMILVLLCLAAIALLWNRRSEAPAWRAGLPVEPHSPQQPSPRAAVVREATTVAQPVSSHTAFKFEKVTQPDYPFSAPMPMAPLYPTSVPMPIERAVPSDLDLDLNLTEMDEESFRELMDYDWGHTPLTRADSLKKK